MRIIGFGYRARSGKDASVAAIIEALGKKYDIRRYAFADELKREVNENALRSGGMRNLFGNKNGGTGGDPLYYWNTRGEVVELPDWVQYDPNPDMTDPFCPLGKQRTLLQWWGTEFRRAVDPDYWVNKLRKRLEQEKPEFALVPDMRFPNEFEFCDQRVLVRRPDLPPATHASETALSGAYWPWDAVIFNKGTLDMLKEDAVLTFKWLRVENILRSKVFVP